MIDNVVKLPLPPRPHPADELFVVIWTLHGVEWHGEVPGMLHGEGRAEAIARLRKRAEVLGDKLREASPEDRVGAECEVEITAKGVVYVRRREPLRDLDAIVKEERS